MGGFSGARTAGTSTTLRRLGPESAFLVRLPLAPGTRLLRAPFAGVLKKIKCKVGDIVQEGVELAELEPVTS